jgi:hypothetical protein
MMPGISHVLFIDESGRGQADRHGIPLNGVQSLWISAAVGIEWRRVKDLDDGVKDILRNRFLGRCSELKAFNLRRYLPSQFNAGDVASDLSGLAKRVGAHVWITCSRTGCPPLPGMAGPRPLAKDVVRQLLLERVSGYATPKYFPNHSWLVVWDLSDVRELTDFSEDLAKFRNLHNYSQLNPAVYPALLGGLSHDWAGIQVADVYANFALHRYGQALGLPDFNIDRATAFEQHLRPTLQKDANGNEVGWKVW